MNFQTCFGFSMAINVTHYDQSLSQSHSHVFFYTLDLVQNMGKMTNNKKLYISISIAFPKIINMFNLNKKGVLHKFIMSTNHEIDMFYI